MALKSSPTTAVLAGRSTTGLLLCAVSLFCSLQRTTAWTASRATHVRFSCPPAPAQSSIASSVNDNSKRHQGQLPLYPARGSGFANGRRAGRSSRASWALPEVGATPAPANDIVCGDAGYAVDEVGKCELEALPALKNRYFALRHGQSVANMEGIISSDPKIGPVSHGLTSNGRAQARAAATALIEVVGRDQLDSLVFISSDFLRARQTAEECRAALQNILSFEQQATAAGGGDDRRETPSEGVENEGAWVDGGGETGGYDVGPPVVTRLELRERYFGELDGTILINYNKVWPEDLKDGKQEGYGVESVCKVAVRVGRLVRSLEREYEDASIVFSSHADTLQIAQCHIAGADERLFSQYRFKNGEVRRLLQDPDSLPPPNPLSYK